MAISPTHDIVLDVLSNADPSRLEVAQAQLRAGQATAEAKRLAKDAVSDAHKLKHRLDKLTILCRDDGPGDFPQGFAAQMKGMKKKLQFNARTLEAYMNAMRTVADILRSAVQENEADGTYTQEQFRHGEF